MYGTQEEKNDSILGWKKDYQGYSSIFIPIHIQCQKSEVF